MPVTRSSSDVSLILEQLRQLHDGGAWHGPSVAEALDGVTAADALRRPLGAAHSIWELVEHLRITNEAARRGLCGDVSPGEPDWPAVGDSSEAVWQQTLARLRDSQRTLREAVGRIANDHVHRDIPGKTHSYFHEVLGLGHHDAYHSGQISLLKKGPGAMATLAAAGRASDIPEAADAYGWLVGSWELDVLHYFADLRGQGLKAQAHFAWVLEGRAIQDVWTAPPAARESGVRMLGTTLRVWDPALQAWRITWINPLTGARAELVGRRSGKDVVQIGTSADGTPIRWSFTDIAADSFRWTGESLDGDGRSWILQGGFQARRLG